MEYRQDPHLYGKSNVKGYEKYRVDSIDSVCGVVGIHNAANPSDYRTGFG